MTEESKPRTYTDEEGQEYEVVWAGDMKISLTGPRPSKRPDYIEDEAQAVASTTRKYTLSGRYIGLNKKKSQLEEVESVQPPQPKIDWGLD